MSTYKLILLLELKLLLGNNLHLVGSLQDLHSLVMSSGAKVPDAWDDDWVEKADVGLHVPFF